MANAWRWTPCALACAVLLGASCTERPREDSPPQPPLSRRHAIQRRVVPAARTTPWIIAPAEFIGIAIGTSDSVELVVVGDAHAAPERAGVSVDLFARAGGMGRATLSTLTTTRDSCEVRTLARQTATPPSIGTWTLALPAHAATAIAFDSLEAHTGLDSLRLAVEVTRLAARVPADTVDVMRGLPYVVRRAWQFTVDSAHAALVAFVSRSLNLEADPRSEQVFLIAERTRGAREWVTQFSERVSGSEADVPGDDVLAAIRMIGSDAVVLAVERMDAAGRQLVLFAAGTDRTWSPVWESAIGCRTN